MTKAERAKLISRLQGILEKAETEAEKEKGEHKFVVKSGFLSVSIELLINDLSEGKF